jgi:hypothetical protein
LYICYNTSLETIRVYSSSLPTRGLLLQKKNFMKNHPTTYYTERSHKSEIPLIFPLSKVSKKLYDNYSEKKRFEKLSSEFIRLKQYIMNDQFNEQHYIKEFIMKHSIYEEELYSFESLNNFSNFLFSEMDIDTSKCVKDIILAACNYNPDRKEKVVRIPKAPVANKVYERVIPDEKLDYSVKFKDLKNTILDKRIQNDINNPKALINTLEHELAMFNEEADKPFGKKNKSRLQSMDEATDTFYKKRDKIEQVKKKHKLLEYVVWERNKNDV